MKKLALISVLFLSLFAVLQPAFAQSYYFYQDDYRPPYYHTGAGFWYRDGFDQYQYITYERFNRTVTSYDEPKRYYSEHHNVELSVSDTKDVVHAGDALTYIITVGNPYGSTANVDVVAYLDPDTDFRYASDNGQRRDSRVSWNNLVLYPYTNRTISMTVRVDTTVEHGQHLKFRVMTDNRSVTEYTDVDDSRRQRALGPTIYSPYHNAAPEEAELHSASYREPSFYDGGYTDNLDLIFRDAFAPDDYTLTNYEAVPPYVHNRPTSTVHNTRPTTTEERYPDRDLQVLLRSNPNGNEVVYTLTVENHSRQQLKDVDVTHVFQQPVIHTDILSTDGGADRGDRIQWDLGYMAPYEYRVMTYRVRFLETNTVRSTVEALSRDPALRAVGADTVQLANRVYAGYDPYAYNYDAVHYPQTGIADFFFRKQTDERSAYLTPVSRSSQKGEVMLLLVSLLAFVGGGLYATRYVTRS